MANPIYQPNDVYITKRNSTSSSFEEYVLQSGQNKIVLFDSASNLVSTSKNELTVGTASYFSGSISNAAFATNAGSASYATTSSYAINSDKLDGYHASDTYTSDTVVVRNDIGAILCDFLFTENGLVECDEIYATAGHDLTVKSFGPNIFIKPDASQSGYFNSNGWNGNVVGTSSWANTASFAMNGGGGGTSLITGSSYEITSSWAVNTINYINYIITSSVVSSSFASSSISSSYALTASFSLNGGGSGTSLTTGSLYPITSSWSVSASYFNQKWIETGSNYPITSSWSNNSISSSYSTNSNTAYSINFIPLTATSASWVSASAKITTADSSSYIDAGNITTGTLLNTRLPLTINITSITASHLGNTTGTSSWSNNSVSSSYSPVESVYSASISLIKQNTLTNTLYPITSSLSLSASYYPTINNVLSSSYASSSLSSSYAPIESNYSASVSSIKQNTLTNTTYTITASFSTTASYALNGGGSSTSLTTGSSYPITSSWSVSSSYAPVLINYSESVSSQINTKQNTLVTGNTYTITSSWSNNSLTASYITASNVIGLIPSSSYCLSGSYFNYVDVNIYQLFTTNSLFASQSVYAVSSSWASSSFTSTTASYALNGGSGGTTLTTGSFYPITSSWSITSSYALNGGGSGGTSLTTGSTYPITSSWAVSSSWSPLMYSLIQMKSGIISGSDFGGSPKTSSVLFSNNFPNSTYSVVVSGESPRNFTAESKTPSGFIVNSNSSVAFLDFVYWQAVNIGLTTENTSSAIPLKSGIVNNTLFGGAPLTASVTFNSNFPNSNYSIILTGTVVRAFTIENKNNTGFVINSNSSVIFIGDVYWQAITVGEYN